MCTHTYLLHALFFWCTYTARTLRRILMLVNTHARLKLSAVRMSFLFDLKFSFLMIHPSSLLLLFLDGHFETTPDDDLNDAPVHTFLPKLST